MRNPAIDFQKLSASNVNLVAKFLALRSIADWDRPEGPVDLLVLLGHDLVFSAEVAADLFRSGKAKRLMVAGGIGHSTHWLRKNVSSDPRCEEVQTRDRTEADILLDVLTVFGVEPGEVLIENRSTNCGANAVEALKVLDACKLNPRTIGLIQDPLMQRRTHASFERAWKGRPYPTFLSWAPLIPELGPDGILKPSLSGLWPMDRFMQLLLGEIPRLLDAPGGYGPSGADFIEHVDIPSEVLLAHERLAAAFAEHINR
jgi:uncharacterized SAM-binding protein YcdF (DUF218 family)